VQFWWSVVDRHFLHSDGELRQLGNLLCS
jgi:hypothetical protein